MDDAFRELVKREALWLALLAIVGLVAVVIGMVRTGMKLLPLLLKRLNGREENGRVFQPERRKGLVELEFRVTDHGERLLALEKDMVRREDFRQFGDGLYKRLDGLTERVDRLHDGG